ncbi:MAG: hypothetical protein KKH91_06585 [Elusimicrobia bacterium]|nr:hypothetical protein [Elusimicrobiota bacterium]
MDKLNLPKDQYAITSSGPLAIRGIREANDLDLIVTPKVWRALSKKYPVKKEGFESIEIGNIHIFWEGSFNKQSPIATVMEQINTADVIKGYRFVNLNLIKKFKLLQGREKDKRDLELIKNYESAKNYG